MNLISVRDGIIFHIYNVKFLWQKKNETEERSECLWGGGGGLTALVK
jgi:hypothetical protein